MDFQMNLILFHHKQDHYAILSISNEWCMVYQSMEVFSHACLEFTYLIKFTTAQKNAIE